MEFIPLFSLFHLEAIPTLFNYLHSISGGEEHVYCGNDGPTKPTGGFQLSSTLCLVLSIKHKILMDIYYIRTLNSSCCFLIDHYPFPISF
jgi:hypothetical protein